MDNIVETGLRPFQGICDPNAPQKYQEYFAIYDSGNPQSLCPKNEFELEARIPLPFRWLGVDSDATLVASQVQLTLETHRPIAINSGLQSVIGGISMYAIEWRIPSNGGLNFTYLRNAGVHEQEAVFRTNTRLAKLTSGELAIARFVNNNLSTVAVYALGVIVEKPNQIENPLSDLYRVIDWMTTFNVV